MADALLQEVNRAIILSRTFDGLFDEQYVIYDFLNNVYISFRNATIVLSHSIFESENEIVIKPCSEEQLHFKLQSTFSELESEEVTVEMLESFCYNHLQVV
jgi:hypothetical protein